MFLLRVKRRPTLEDGSNFRGSVRGRAICLVTLGACRLPESPADEKMAKIAQVGVLLDFLLVRVRTNGTEKPL